jgi:hypothetical protein
MEPPKDWRIILKKKLKIKNIPAASVTFRVWRRNPASTFANTAAFIVKRLYRRIASHKPGEERQRFA